MPESEAQRPMTHGHDDEAPRKPMVSVILPAFNAEPYVFEAVKSILGQTFRDFELLVVDDGSTDGTLSECRRATGGDPRVKTISQPNRGLVASLNTGLQMARGKYVARMDADDRSRPLRLQRQVDYLESHPETILVGCAMQWIDADGDPIKRSCGALDHEGIMMAYRSGRTQIAHPTWMLRSTAIQTVGFYDPRYRHAEDFDYALRCAEAGRLANIPDILLDYRWHGNNISLLQRAAQREATLEALIASHTRKGSPPIPLPTLLDCPAWIHDSYFRAVAWDALQNGEYGTARKWAKRYLRQHPAHPQAWATWTMAILSLGCLMRAGSRIRSALPALH